MINYYEYYDFSVRGGIWNTKSRKRLAFVCVFLFCVVVQHTTGYPKDFYPCDDPISFWRMLPRDVGKFGDWFA